ncbi:hemicentin-1-like isoform X2 [Oscarella lobularis]|uniref:hemicentin-1-like isoform X2 n=1 Tax=Oscarella lobularis TaxID=121494 RepID=UPI0033134D72
MFTLFWGTLFLLKFISVQSCSLICFNDGYASSDCSHCVCPSGWTGLRCSSASPCGDVLKVSAGYLTSPGFPEDYDRNRNCTWTFDSSLSPSVILLRIVSVDLSGAINDSLRITDQTQNLAVIYGSRHDFRSRDVIKVDSSVVIRFSSGSYVSSRRGFSLEYHVFPGIEPQFISTPNDTTILKGKTVSFFCFSSGFPQPTVRWEKDGENVTLPEGSENGELRIQNANEATDSGLYDCIAENYLGSVRHQFFVAVHVPPVITHAPVDAVFDYYLSSEYVYFRCDAYGIPEPEIYWKKDGKFIRNPSFPDSVSRWIRVRVSSKKFGKYSCYANNSVGAVESSSAVFSGKNASDILFHGDIYMYGSNSWVNTNSSVAFYFYSCCGSEIQIRRIFRDGISLNALKFEGLDTTFNSGQYVSFDYATASDSGVYKFEIQVLVYHQYVFETYLFSYMHTKAFPRPVMFSPSQRYPFHPDKSLLLVCTERQSYPRSSLQFFLNGVKMNQTGPSHYIYVYDRRLYLFVRNLTDIITNRMTYYNNWLHAIGANFTCQATMTYFGQAKNASVLIDYPYYIRYHGNFWSLWSSITHCSVTCGRNSGFRLRYRTCYFVENYRYPCYGGQNEVEACFSRQNCSSVTDSPSAASNSTNITAIESATTRLPTQKAGELSAGVASAVTLAAVLVAMSALAVIIVVIFKKKKISFCQSPRAEADRPTAPQASAANAYLSRPAILEAKMQSNVSVRNVDLNDAGRGQEMTVLPVYEDVQDFSPEKKDKIKWTTTSLYETVNVQVTVQSDASD